METTDLAVLRPSMPSQEEDHSIAIFLPVIPVRVLVLLCDVLRDVEQRRTELSCPWLDFHALAHSEVRDALGVLEALAGRCRGRSARAVVVVALHAYAEASGPMPPGEW